MEKIRDKIRLINRGIYNNLIINFPYLFDFNKLSKNENINERTIYLTRNEKWNWFDLSNNPAISFELVEKTQDKDWCYCSLTKNISITNEDIINHDTLPWNWNIFRDRFLY
jgi:hypothetical protein